MQVIDRKPRSSIIYIERNTGIAKFILLKKKIKVLKKVIQGVELFRNGARKSQADESCPHKIPLTYTK